MFLFKNEFRSDPVSDLSIRVWSRSGLIGESGSGCILVWLSGLGLKLCVDWGQVRFRKKLDLFTSNSFALSF